ncbi:THUMP domain-containing class I SAM-dependent RNA methyltransferase [Anaeromyxobacter oryzisoli]|uniref:THUMP domain-containing class I SAM-dependent RNA methyltransferase n=1 Tax=Anaeromyxobacter oryzisoli TaxID=2925408 RepID=UPI001F566CD8|nr:THUMP domain-containing protein [Anaeromyxobacter sp. SG63]
MKFFATCAKGTEGALRRELVAMRLGHIRGDRGGVAFEGPMESGLRACLHARTAMRMLLELGRFPAPDADALYAGVRAIDWEPWLDVRTTLAVEATVSSRTITHSGFAALKVKDAVVDAVRARHGARPDVDPKDPDVRIVLHLARDEAALSLDLAGSPLHRRGYRAAMTEAPLKETLAAAILLLGGVDPAIPFVDPMAGSGTLAIEHGLRARRIAPGLGRAFGFQRWPGYRGAVQSTWDRLREEARAAVLPRAPAPILARDGHPKAILALRRNVEAAGLAGDVVIEQADARALEPIADAGAIVTNPPYGERLGGAGPGASPAEARVQEKKLVGFYRGLAEMLARHHGWSAVLLSGNPLLARAIPLRPTIDHRLWNGPLETHLLTYRIP